MVGGTRAEAEEMSLPDRLYSFQHAARQWLVGRRHELLHPRPGAVALDEGFDPERILVVMSGLIGDTVMCTPVLAGIRRSWPRAHVTLLGREHNCELLSACPYLDSVKSVSIDPYAVRRWTAVRELRHWLRGEAFHLAIIALGDQFASMLAEAEIPVRVGRKGHLLEPCLTHCYSIGSARTWGPDERLNSLRCLGVGVADLHPQLWVSPLHREAARSKLSQAGIEPGRDYAVLHPFGSTPRQWWPPERIADLCDAIASSSGLDVVLAGGPETRRSESPRSGRCVDATGLLTIAELAAVLDGARTVISTDSGPFHMAGALGRPLVGLFRASRPEHSTRYPHALALFGEDEECVRSCRWDLCRNLPCRQMRSIRVEDIAFAAARTRAAA
jgi:ADP-heptose:LPS heptosyltransferase